MQVYSKLLTGKINWQVLYSCSSIINKNCFAKKKTVVVLVLERYRLWVKHLQEFVFYSARLLHCLGSDAGSNGVESASGFVIQNRQTVAPRSGGRGRKSF